MENYAMTKALSGLSHRILDTRQSDFRVKFDEILARGNMDLDNAMGIVQGILQEIKQEGISALLRHIKQFDNWNPKDFSDIMISKAQCERAYNALDSQTKQSLHIAYERIFAFHSKQKEKTWLDMESNGNILGQKVTPLERAGLYIPGGKAAYPSSLLMNAIPAIVAGVKEIIVCTPTPHNEPNELLLASLHLCGITQAYKVGGASAIGLMAYGCSECKKVDVITGPGNIFVATAKKLVFGDVQIDMIAGPSEIGIIASSGANVEYIAWDLLSQAEHDELASAILISDDRALIESVISHIQDILPTLKRAQITQKSIQNRSVFIHTQNLEQSVELMNEIAPEHLEVLVSEPFSLLPRISNAGAIFLGQYASEPIGDYLAGPNHTLPTGGSARFFSPLGVEHFMKKSSIIYFSKEAMKELGCPCANLADIEGLEAHKNAVLSRVRDLKHKGE